MTTDVVLTLSTRQLDRKIGQHPHGCALLKLSPTNGRGTGVSVHHDFNQFASRAGEEFGRLGAQVDLRHRHVEDGLGGGLIFRAEKPYGFGSVFRTKADLLAGFVLLGVVSAVGSAV